MVDSQIRPYPFPMFVIKVFYYASPTSFIFFLCTLAIFLMNKNKRTFPTTNNVFLLVGLLHFDLYTFFFKTSKQLQALPRNFNLALFLLSLFNILKQGFVNTKNQLHFPNHLLNHGFKSHLFIYNFTQPIQIIINNKSGLRLSIPCKVNTSCWLEPHTGI